MTPNPARDQWRAELDTGERTATTFDALWRAACLEAEAECEEDGLRDRADKLRQTAATLLGIRREAVAVAAAQRERRWLIPR